MMAKNTKAASRIQNAFASRQVYKEYLCIVHGTNTVLKDLYHRSWSQEQFHNRRLANTLDDSTVQKRKKSQPPADRSMGGVWTDTENVRVLAGMLRKRPDGKGSVQVTPIITDQNTYLFQNQPPQLLMKSDDDIKHTPKRDGKFCFLEYRHVGSVPRNKGGDHHHRKRPSPSHTTCIDRTNDNSYWHVLAIRTQTGMRHQIRALLSQVGGCPIVGDCRYGGGGSGGSGHAGSLPDQSVALHARAIYLPSVQLGGTDLISQPYVAPIPQTWLTFFGLTEESKFVRTMHGK
jgi:hypothetical protein